MNHTKNIRNRYQGHQTRLFSPYYVKTSFTIFLNRVEHFWVYTIGTVYNYVKTFKIKLISLLSFRSLSLLTFFLYVSLSFRHNLQSETIWNCGCQYYNFQNMSDFLCCLFDIFTVNVQKKYTSSENISKMISVDCI